jgi:hypothetical protein
MSSVPFVPIMSLPFGTNFKKLGFGVFNESIWISWRSFRLSETIYIK